MARRDISMLYPLGARPRAPLRWTGGAGAVGGQRSNPNAYTPAAARSNESEAPSSDPARACPGSGRLAALGLTQRRLARLGEPYAQTPPTGDHHDAAER